MYTGFLFKKIHINKTLIDLWLKDVPGFQKRVEELIAANATIDDRAVFEIMKDIYNADADNSHKRFMRVSLRKLAGFLGLDDSEWSYGVEQKPRREIHIEVPEGFQDVAWVARVSEEMRSGTRKLLCSPDFLAKMRGHSEENLEEVYRVLREVFYNMVRSGARDNPETQRTYYRYREAIKEFSKHFHGDAEYWHEDYKVFYNIE